MSIAASQKSLREVFRPDDYQFMVPAYQRPYAWGKNEAIELIEDLLDAHETNPDTEYFLGSIVIVRKDGSPLAEVVDGQQRLTSLSILISVIRHLIPEENEEDRRNIGEMLQRQLFGRKSLVLTLKKSDQEFFYDMVIEESRSAISQETGISRLLGLKRVLPSSQNCIKVNAQIFQDTLQKYLSENYLNDNRFLREFAEYLLQQVRMVIVSSDSLESAYKIFSTMNNRGLDLGTPDLIKALLLEQISEGERQVYANIWEDEEASLTELNSQNTKDTESGRKLFDILFTHIHRIYTKQRSSKNLFADFKNDVLNMKFGRLSEESAKDFILKDLTSYSNAYESILSKSVKASDPLTAGALNNLLLPLLHRIPNSDWQPPAIAFISRYQDNTETTKLFIEHLERVAACSLLLGENVNMRARRYKPILEALDNGISQTMSVISNSLTDEDITKACSALQGDVYGESFVQYVLLRLDSELAENKTSASLSAGILTIEHVLPQTINEYWRRDWKESSHREWKNKLGNLVLLSKRKNSQAKNYDFETKKKTYFSDSKDGAGHVTTFPTTTNVLRVKGRWTPRVVSENQDNYIQVLTRVWRLVRSEVGE
ncbi:MAG: DUF262 domain-containing HNH endonuclease family protein [Synechococcus sp. ELA057]